MLVAHGTPAPAGGLGPGLCYAWWMPRFQPFAGVRYTSDDRLDDVLAPPYDVITADERAALVARSPYNAVRLELPADEGGRDRYQVAASLWASWRADGVLRSDDEASFYVYRMGYRDAAGTPRQTTGVIGALALSTLDEGDVLPHEHTTPKARADRLDLLRTCRANLSPIWALSTTPGLTELCELPAPPDARGTDADGVHHRPWRVSQPGLVEAIAAAVAAAPVIVADGHHRYETALAYRDERRAATGGSAGGHDAVMAWVVEARQDQLTVAPTHRLLSGLPEGFDVVDALSASFDVEPAPAPPGELPARMAAEGALALGTTAGWWLLRPTPATEQAAEHALDSSRLDVALAAFPPHTLEYQHGVAAAAAAVADGRAQAAVLLRPASVDQIARIGRGAARMPAKTTFFTPKPRTGMVFRSLDA
jgi:uncharacterized protein (DUF1015 family)